MDELGGNELVPMTWVVYWIIYLLLDPYAK